MVLKDGHRWIISLILIFSLNALTDLAACPIKTAGAQSWRLEMKVPSSQPDMVEIHGEVVDITAIEVSIDNGVQKYQLPLAANAQIFCNGLPAVWLALRPVTPEAFFEAKIRVNQQNEVVYIAGMYQGEICVLRCWRLEQDKLFLKLSAADSGQTFWRMVEPHAKLPGVDWLEEDIEIYVLYNNQRNIRAVFLPE
jgi:hypothetical protein